MSRDALVRLQVSLEDQILAGDENTRVRLERELRDCLHALQWDETRQAGRHYFVWRGGKVIPAFLIVAAAPLAVGIATGRPLTTFDLVLSGILMPAVFAGCVGVLYHGWNVAERRYFATLERAKRLAAQPDTALPPRAPGDQTNEAL